MKNKKKLRFCNTHLLFFYTLKIMCYKKCDGKRNFRTCEVFIFDYLYKYQWFCQLTIN